MGRILDIGTRVKLIHTDSVDEIVGLEKNDEGVIVDVIEGTFNELYLIDFPEKYLDPYPIDIDYVEEVVKIK